MAHRESTRLTISIADRHTLGADRVLRLTSNGRIRDEGPPTVNDQEVEALTEASAHPRPLSVEDLASKEGESDDAVPEPRNDTDDEALAKRDPMRRKGDSAMYAYFLKSAGWFNSVSFFVALAGYAFSGTFPCKC
jgi:hypothetical protein